ncbi:hypothetical protein GCM10027517_35800 [Phycicoccus ginsengisoli]
MELPDLTRRTVLAAGLAGAALGLPGAASSRASATGPAGSGTTGPPALLPATQQWTPGADALRLTPAARIVLTQEHPDLRSVAEVLAEDLVADGHLTTPPRTVVTSRPLPHDIVLDLGQVPGAAHPEAYSLVADRTITVSGPTPTAVFWGTRTLVQALRSGAVRGAVVDWPRLDERALMLDLGRKYFSPEWIKSLIREMSYLKLNTLQLHISEGLGFRVECETHPEIVSEQHLTKAEVRDLLDFARRRHVSVNGDVDSPGHLDHILRSHPDLQLVLADGTRHTGFLDFSKPEGRALVHDIVGEMCDLFDGPVFHLGGDEFLPAPWQGSGADVVSDRTAPQLVAYARQVTGNPTATAHDGYEHYLDELAALVRSKGKRARIFNDDVYPGEGATRMDPDTEVDVWIRWNATKPTAQDYVDAGHRVVNGNGDYLYFILTSSGVGQGPYKNPKGIYERWTPRTFMGRAGSAGDFVLPEDQPLLGAHLSVWCDSPDSMTEAEVARDLHEWLQVFAQQVWGSPRPAETLAELEASILPVVGRAPAPR